MPALQPNGALLATGQRGKNSDVVIWDEATGTPRFRLQEHDKDIALVTFSPDSKLLLTIGGTEWVVPRSAGL